MSPRKKTAASIAIVMAGTAIFAAYANAQPHEIGNGVTLTVEIGVGLAIAIILFHWSSRREKETQEVLDQIKKVSDQQAEFKNKQSEEAKQELIENLNGISKDAKIALYCTDLQTNRLQTGAEDSIPGICDDIGVRIRSLDRLNTAARDFLPPDYRKRLHTLAEIRLDEPVDGVNGVRFCMRIKKFVDGWLGNMARPAASDAGMVGEDETVMSASVDRVVYPIGGTVYVRAKVIPLIKGEKIRCEARGQDGNVLWSSEIDPEDGRRDPELSAQNTFETAFKLGGPEWETERAYAVTAAYKARSATAEFSVGRHMPVLESDKQTYARPSGMVITVIDPDSNKDNKSAEYVGDRPDSRLVIETDLGKIDGCRLAETGPDTGIFQGTVEIVDEGDPQAGPDETARANGTGGGRIACRKGGEIRMTYTNGTDTAELTAYAENHNVVKTDQKTYTCTDKVHITIMAPDFSEPDRVSLIGGGKDCTVSVCTSVGELGKYVLAETGPGTGVFTGEVRLTGFAGMEDHIRTGVAAKRRFGATGGNGPTDGTLACRAQDSIEVLFDAGGDRSRGAATVEWNAGVVALDRPGYRVGETAVVAVADPDMNLDPDAEDCFKIRVWSDSDKKGIWLTVRETGPATGMFTGSVLFDSSGSSETEARLRVAVGDTVRAEYEDTTVPGSSGAHDARRRSSSSLITGDGTVTPPLERARLEMDIRNEKTGTEVIKSGDAVAVAVKATVIESPASFVAIVQIEGINGASAGPVEHPMDSESGPTEHTFAWTPPAPGVFTVTAFLWKSMDNPVPLCGPVSKEVNVV